MPLVEGYNKLKSKAEQIVESVKTSKLLSQKKDIPLPYAYPCDNYMDSILSNGLVRKTLQLFADKYCKEQIQNIKSTGQLVSQANYPHFYDILQSCYKSLSVEEISEVYITSQLKGINALSVGTDNAPIILISRKAVISLSDGELKFMIGHELGHILQKNLMCHTIKGLLDNLNRKSEILGPIVSDLIDVPLNQWYRCAEYTADRAGLICSKSISHIKSLFSRLCNTTIKETNQIARYFELSNIHPIYNNRIKQLEQFILQQQ
ncbi:M48 family metallopeptidase [Parabacteroides pacaensis]|uniref:M48 family metallopeptidase n=1 Tax=Parabacteroides pacaensis TaxID=2086575 RepID=UPI000D1042DF|nr:M48 family metallopeptidase [Parabacteroides pacaensis]